MKKILMIAKCPTHPTNAGNRWGILAMCKAFMDLGCNVHFLYIEERALDKCRKEEYDNALNMSRAYWNNNFHIFSVTKLHKVCKNFLLRYRKKKCDYHQGLYDEYPAGIDKYVANLQSKFQFDVCIVNYIYMTKLFDSVKFKKMACFTHDAFAYKNLVVKENCLWMDAHQEATALQKCTDIFAVQDEEMHYFHILSPNSRHYNIYSKYTYIPQSIVNNKNIVFLSGNNEFNQNGLKWFIENIFPLIREKFKESKLLIAGGICKVIRGVYDDIDGVELKGYVDDPKGFYALGDVAINPTYQGTGLKIKTFEAIANDKVTMVHPHSMTGVYKKDSAPLFASDNPEEWVAYLDTIWEHPEKIRQIKKRNQSYLEDMNKFIIHEYKRFLEY